MKRLSRGQYTTRLDATVAPKLVLEPGEVIDVETWDAFMGVWDAGRTRPIIGPMAGPIAVRGATPGDAVKVELLEIRVIDAAPGRSALHNSSSSHGFLKEEFSRHHPIIMQIEDGYLLFPGGIKIRLNPSVGLIATTFIEPQKPTSDSGPYGGDIDMKELTAGSIIWLPVFVPDALLCLGDVHAVAGDGCVGGTAAECCAQVRSRVSVEKKCPSSKTPYADARTPHNPWLWRGCGRSHEAVGAGHGALPRGRKRHGSVRGPCAIEPCRGYPYKSHISSRQSGEDDAIPQGAGSDQGAAPAMR
jgi:amidase